MYFLYVCIFCVVLCIVCFVSFFVLFVCICVLYYCHRVAAQLQLNMSYIINNWLVPPPLIIRPCIIIGEATARFLNKDPEHCLLLQEWTPILKKSMSCLYLLVGLRSVESAWGLIYVTVCVTVTTSLSPPQPPGTDSYLSSYFEERCRLFHKVWRCKIYYSPLLILFEL
jgi:hypothetical protein